MNTHAGKSQTNECQSVAGCVSKNEQDLEAVSLFADNRAIATAQRKLKVVTQAHSDQKNQPLQRIMAKTGMDVETYKKKTRTTVILYAELDGEPVGTDGIFMTTSDMHAEENLIASLEATGRTGGTLTILLSTSPCSSTFCTRSDEELGCQERLEALNSKGFSVTVTADHLYQPKDVGAMEREYGYPTGFSSASSAHASEFPLKLSGMPKRLKHEDLMDTSGQGKVAQLK